MAVNIDDLNLYLEYANRLNGYYGVERLHHESLIERMELDISVSMNQLDEMHSYLENMNKLNSYFGEEEMDFEHLFNHMESCIRLGQLSLFL